MQTQPDTPLDYTNLESCCPCGSEYELRTYPVGDGYVVAVCCKGCRVKSLPLRFSTETEVFNTFGRAEIERHRLLLPYEVAA